MRKSIAKLGRLKVTLIITLVSVAASILLTVTALVFTNNPITPITLKIATFVPLLIAPSVTWPIIGLILHMDDLEKRIRQYSHFDELTGLMSRRHFFENAEQYFVIASRYQKSFSILLLDLDHFKEINDTYGHMAGDDALRSFGEQLAAFKRESDIAGRFGGEEFIFLLPETNTEHAFAFAEKVRVKTENMQITYQDESITMTVSVGVAMYDPDHPSDNLIHLINEADKALYAAKKSGRNRVIAFQR